jgi:hypothetical protein
MVVSWRVWYCMFMFDGPNIDLGRRAIAERCEYSFNLPGHTEINPTRRRAGAIRDDPDHVARL